MKYYSILFILLHFLTYSTSAQTDNKVYKKIAFESIKQMKDGVLLVRLSNKEKAIEALKKQGLSKQANELKEEQEITNKKIASAFEKEFDFCPTYFFYSKDSKKIKEGKLQEVDWLNANSLEKDKGITVTAKNYFIAEFGYFADDNRTFEGDLYKHVGENGLEIRRRQYGTSGSRQKGLIVRSQELVPLPKPFPYFINHSMFADAATLQNVIVGRLNKKLKAFYNRVIN